jgi:mono/diheme cytochrome c family protein
MKRTVFFGILMFLLMLTLTCNAQMGGMMEGQMPGMGQGQMMGGENPSETGGAGAKIFSEHCASCHPHGGNIIVPDLPLKGSRVLANYKTFAAFIRNPKMPDGSHGAMPSFGEEKISDEQARELYHYIKTAGMYDARGGMGPGMMGGYGMGPGMMGGYGMGPGMMGGYGMRYRCGMGPESFEQSEECQKFYDDTAKLRKELHDKRFEYFETIRNPKTTMGTAADLRKEIRELQEKIYSKAPIGCW